MAKAHHPSPVRSVQSFTPIPLACLLNALDIAREIGDSVSVEIISDHIRRLLEVWRQSRSGDVEARDGVFQGSEPSPITGSFNAPLKLTTPPSRGESMRARIHFQEVTLSGQESCKCSELILCEMT